ncbi:FIG00553685: hypothetical protein [Cronobacter condimenti 1330]|uniref:Uncharacterized protein n=1 Tax=Cronobacter condimenti 1330 TaxID=1073999 RepID=K8A8P9_9ENTR|nr:FIG00553685: hypothetical protein [Cronobacter condimenti 1330]
MTLLLDYPVRYGHDIKENLNQRTDTMRKTTIILLVVAAVVWGADYLGWL